MSASAVEEVSRITQNCENEARYVLDEGIITHIENRNDSYELCDLTCSYFVEFSSHVKINW